MKKSPSSTKGTLSASAAAPKKTPMSDPDSFVAIKVEIISAENLIAADSNGLSDPYVSLRLHDGASQTARKTKVIPKSLNPVWNETFEFVVAKDKINSTDLQLRVWDKDLVGKDLLGDLALPLSKVTGDFAQATPLVKDLLAKNYSMVKNLGTLKFRIGFIPLVSDWTELDHHASELTLQEEHLGQGISILTPGDFKSVEGVLLLKIVSARNLPKEKGAASFDCDPFVIASMGTNTFRTRVIRHDPNPVWNEQMVLVVKKSEVGFSVKFSVYDYDRFSGNDFLATASVPLSVFLKADGPLENHEVSLELRKQDGFDRAQLVISGHFKPFPELKRQFWKKLAESFDTNDNNALDKFEFVGMLDSLNTEVTQDRVAEMYQKHGDKIELSFDEVSEVMDELARHHGEGKLFALETCPFTGVPLPDNDEDALLHLVIHASADLSKVDRFVMGGFVTESYAKKGWFNRIVNYVTRGEYGVGVDNANIIVQNRKTGQLEEEKMPSYVRLGIRALYQSKLNKFGLGSNSVKALLTSLSIKQGRKYDDPASAASIAPFIAFHRLSVAEILDPLDSFKTFNEFFYRKLKPSARPIASPDPAVLLSPADARVMVFPSFDAATNLWIKGRNFTVGGILKDAELANQFQGGSLAIFRLAPQDYHRYHSPCNGVLGTPMNVAGTLYTVNPMAIREEVDVYTENKRIVWVIDSPEFGKVALVIIGAMMVGSIILTAKAGQKIARNEELGYFAFGGSTVVAIFQKDAVEFDADLMENAAKQLETLVMVGDAVGKRRARAGK